MKKILIISYSNVFPPYWGGASRIYNLTKFLAKENKIWFLCNDFRFLKDRDPNCAEYDELRNNPNVKIFFIKPMLSKSQIINFSLISKALKIAKKEKPDVILASHLFSALNAIVISWFSRIPYFLDEHNIEFIRHNRLYKKRKLQQTLLKIYEKFACNKAKKIFCVSKNDKELLISKLKINEDKTILIPNAVDTDKFYPSKKNSDQIKKELKLEGIPIILFFGKLDYKPNYEAVEIIQNEILPRIMKKNSKAKFLIVGDNPPLNFQHKNIIFTGLVNNIEDYINVSDVVICPLLSGGGTRLKILEALCCGKIVISTKIGAEGIMLNKSTESLLILDDWDNFSNKIVSILSTKNVFKDVDFYSFSWTKSVDKINDFISS